MNHEIHEAHEKAETMAYIFAEMHKRMVSHYYSREGRNLIWQYADRFEAAWRREADSIERLVRDAIIDYQEMYAHAPNDDAERELIDRAERGNAWLVAHGYEPERLCFRKGKHPTTEKSSLVGNAAELREVVTALAAVILPPRDKAGEGGWLAWVRAMQGKARDALAKPPRNCDVGTAKQQEKRYMEECLRSLDCYECKLDQGGCDCRFHWGQMPYEEGGAK